MRYFDELKRTMEWLAQQPKVMFVGQTVAGPGTFMFQTLRDCGELPEVDLGLS